jgi:hypothetical protein
VGQMIAVMLPRGLGIVRRSRRIKCERYLTLPKPSRLRPRGTGPLFAAAVRAQGYRCNAKPAPWPWAEGPATVEGQR